MQLAAVVQAGGVTEGAALLGLAQPGVSRTLSLLEKRVGEPLFVRSKRPLQPTPLGRALAEHGQAILNAARKASDTIESFRIGKSGVVRVGGTPFFMDALIAPMIAEFQNNHPDVRVDLTYGYFSDLRAALNADQIDLAICPFDLLGEGSGLVFRPIMPGRNVVACSVTHPLLLKRHLEPSHMLEYPWISPPPGSPLLVDFRSMLLSIGGTDIKIRYSGGSLMSIAHYLRGSEALAIMPHSVVFALRNDRSVSALPVSIPHPERALGLLSRGDALHMPAVDQFAQYVEVAFGNLKTLIKRHEQSVVWGH